MNTPARLSLHWLLLASAAQAPLTTADELADLLVAACAAVGHAGLDPGGRGALRAARGQHDVL